MEQAADPPAVDASTLKQSILDFLRSQAGCTFAQLVRAVPGCSGTCAVGSAFNNVFLWSGLSRECVEALFALEKEKSIQFEPCELEDYGLERLKLPEAVEMEDHPTPHWLPILMRAKAKRATKMSKKGT